MAETEIGQRQLQLFLCGDVMTGRGIDQILPHPGDPIIHEPYVRNARDYLRLAEIANGPIPHPVDFGYIWGDALDVLEAAAPDARIINLETSITTSADYWPRKGINYRMHPANTPCLTAARIDCCVLANNHVIDWGYSGLEETLETLRKAGLKTAGAGRDREEAAAPAVLDLPGGQRLLVFGFGTGSSGIPDDWAAGEERSGVNLLEALSQRNVDRLAEEKREYAAPGDLCIASIHWGGNWGYAISAEQQAFARALIEAGFDLIHGHSSHHVKGFEIHRGRLILYGCGDFLNDYEGIGGHDAYRGDLSLMYFPFLDSGTGRLERLRMVPMRTRRFRLERAGPADTEWLASMLDREAGRFGAGVILRNGELCTD
ncbi:CapA family protein [Thiohalomonas denitrificans]|uniref:CapA family protein n=1 Tax=Thiohalomonas denitrificans TaxID=415747 RepID=UPI0026F28344|nr:CapA family protein [Thiohalomonas denitrificans]